MPVAAEGVSPRERGVIPLRSFSFHREYRDHDRFEVSITDEIGSFRYQVRAWGNMIDSVHAFTTSVAHIGMCQRAKRDIFMTGYALVSGFNVRVTPVA
ncbi:hypothetical protein SEA_SUCCESS_92 [Streptomyces phage Success]|uniref:Uncharacterized protein n=1 Tax=Streptomyces phage Success TaxID=2999013 RepID=A0A9E8M5L2_9CAUD|nr:hypothetical protein QEH47_gp40 [Streptomyces phage Success]WAB08871.1 hypothetical protein SEA_SUCCESS_92 [Streptomyces phage Success]